MQVTAQFRAVVTINHDLLEGAQPATTLLKCSYSSSEFGKDDKLRRAAKRFLAGSGAPLFGSKLPLNRGFVPDLRG